MNVGAVIYRYRSRLSSRVGVITMVTGLMIQTFEVWALNSKLSVSPAEMYVLLGTLPFAAGLNVCLIHFPHWRAIKLLAGLGSYSLGAYAVHVLWLEPIIQQFQNQQGVITGILLVLTVALLSFGTVWLMAKIDALKPVVS